MNTTWTTIPTQEIIDQTATNLTKNGFNTIIVASKEDAKAKVLELLPEGAEVMTMSSVTIDSIGLFAAINSSGKYNAVKAKLMTMDRATQGREMQKLGAAPDYAVGSVNAVTQDGKVLIASNTGSQIPAYAYAASHVIWVVGAQKIVKDVAEGETRINDYILPLESKRLEKVFQLPDYKSNVSKLLIMSREINPKRMTLILVQEPLGF
ncbi:MAG TPA: LUD domain-containing protein [Patescibacteria group bacterium]|nr:LUD domain-containing protein [Patescibacteria group bacterium]